ncbi:GxxExxY protein [Flavobacterium difficile]|uniref:GxxExxY protein n=1 Tax=Flavobacterium difficile TaxID=2709659 RepID=A0ABX0I715_9FLAO|nr:GxxExxY protein [Flavobacterium difficile]NHM01285.1 GxxExxY protein [Flavobacterium difficile]
MITQQSLNQLTFEIIGAAIEVHKILGKGLLESVYHKCMIEELKIRKINFKSEFKVPFNYKGNNVDVDFRCDLFIEDLLIVELKAVSDILPIHDAQLLTYMKLLSAPKGILINFNSNNIFREGQKTLVNDLFKNLPK